MPASTSKAPRAAKVAPRPRTKPAQVRREELLDAAERLFLEKGFASTSVDDIVVAADVAKGTFYLHFTSKDALLIGLRDRFVQSFCDAIAKGLAKRRADDWRGKLRTWVQVAVGMYVEQIALHDILFHEFQPHDRQSFLDNPAVIQLAEVLAQGAAADAYELGDPRLTSVMLCHALHGAADHAVLSGEAGRKNILRNLESFVLRAAGAR